MNNFYMAKAKLQAMPSEHKKIVEHRGLSEAIERAEKQVEYMSKIVFDLQSLSSSVKLELTVASVCVIVREALSTASIPETITVSAAAEDPADLPRMTVDTAAMKRVFVNLTNNVAQVMPEGGLLTVDVSRSAGSVLVKFTDMGVGIPEEDLGKVFQPFFSTRSKGMGLGLSACKRIVEAHGGEIVVESWVGEGTRVTVRIPLRQDTTQDAGDVSTSDVT